MAHSDNDDEQNVVDDPIDDPVIAYADSIETVLACQLDGVLGTRIFKESSQTGGDSLLNRPSELSDLAGRSR